MKLDYRDVVFTTLALVLTIGGTLCVLYLLAPWLAVCYGGLYALAFVVTFLAVYGLATVAYTRLVHWFLPFKEGVYPTNHVQFFLWRHLYVCLEMAQRSLALFFPVFVRPVMYALIGTKMGRHVVVAGTILDPLMVTMEDYAVVGRGALVLGHMVTFDKFYLKRTIIRRAATVGIGSVILPGAEIGERSVVAPGSVVEMDTKIPPYEFWGGTPARKIKDIVSPETSQAVM